MTNKKPIISRWYVKVVIVIFCLLTGYLVVQSFIEGFKEGREKARQEMLKKK
jgi:hypothetical protein